MLSDKLVEQEGELYEGEKEGGDLRNREGGSTSAQKRTASSPLSASGGSSNAGSKKTRTGQDKKVGEGQI